MHMKKKSFSLVTLTFVILLFVISNSAIAKQKVVNFLSLGDYTGPIGAIVVPADEAIRDYFRYINEQGGIDGIKLNFIGMDTRYDVARALSSYKRFRKTKRLLLVSTYGTAIDKAILPLVAKDKLFALSAGSGEFVAKPGRAVLYGPSYQDAFCAALDWMVNDWKQKGNFDMPKVGYMGWGNAYGHEHLRGGKEYASHIGVDLLKPEFFSPGTMDHSTYLTRLKKANYIYVTGIDPTPTNVIRDAYRLGMTKNIQFMTGYYAPMEKVGLEVHNKELQGVVATSFHLRGNEMQSHPLTNKIWGMYHKEPISEMNGIYGQGLVFAKIFIEGLKIALKDVGYDKLDGTAMYRAYQQLTGRDISEGIQGLISYSPTERRGSREIRFYRVKGDTQVPISGWIKTPDALKYHQF